LYPKRWIDQGLDSVVENHCGPPKSKTRQAAVGKLAKTPLRDSEEAQLFKRLELIEKLLLKIQMGLLRMNNPKLLVIP